MITWILVITCVVFYVLGIIAIYNPYLDVIDIKGKNYLILWYNNRNLDRVYKIIMRLN